ncbi:TIGR04140 family protein [Thermococcus sp.]
MRTIETAVSFEELRDIKRMSGADIRLTLLKKVERNGILLNVVLIEGKAGEVERFMEKLRLARAGG